MNSVLQALATVKGHGFWGSNPLWRLFVALGGDRATSNKYLDDFIQSIRDMAPGVQDAHHADAAEFTEFAKSKCWPGLGNIFPSFTVRYERHRERHL
jgi:hypothetical protein